MLGHIAARLSEDPAGDTRRDEAQKRAQSNAG